MAARFAAVLNGARAQLIKLESVPMAFTRARTFASLIALMMSATLVQAGPLATTNLALNDGDGPDAGRWHGSVTVAGVDPLTGDTLAAEIEWAAFARTFTETADPGKFQQYLDSQAIAQVDPSEMNEVIYVYQITSVSSAAPGIDALTVGLDVGDGWVAGSATFIPAGGGTEKSPTSDGGNGTSISWSFLGNPLQVGDTSSLLVFRSPFAPEFDSLSVNSGGAAQFPPPLVASPSDRLFQFDIPEPSSAALCLLCSMGLLVKGTGRRHH